MRKSILIHLIASLLTLSFLGELVVHLNGDTLITAEMDTDSEEKESKEDKLKEYTFQLDLFDSTPIALIPKDSYYLISNWSSPIIEHLTQPPENR